MAVITGNNAANFLVGGAPNDVIRGLGGNDQLIGNAGDDVLDGGTGADQMIGGTGNDRYYVDNAGDTTVEGFNSGVDSVYSTITWTLSANVENLVLIAGAINGTGNGLNNAITGSAGNNFLQGGGGDDKIVAGLGFDILLGDAGADTLIGGDGADVANGGTGSDRLYGGLGMDTLTGGAGNDWFIFDTAPGAGNVDSILDFNSAADSIGLMGIVFPALSTGVLNAAEFRVGPVAIDPTDRIIYDMPTGNLFYDADGNGAGAQVQFASVVPGTFMNPADFIVA